MLSGSIRLTIAISSIAAIAGLGACASGVTRMDAPSATGAAPAASAALAPAGPVKAVTLWLNDGAKKLVAENAKFNPEALRGTVERLLQAQSLVKADATQTMDIEITSFRVRSNFSAVMFGFMAGSDNVEGVVTVKDAAGQVVKRARVNASYALGGFGGGQDDARMGWLYEEFAKHALAEVTGKPAK